MTDANPEPSTPAAEARHLIRKSLTAVLSTLDEGAAPWGSLVLVASDYDATPVLLLSTLALHTQNLARDGRASLLFDGTSGLDVPMTGARVTVSGVVEKTDAPVLRQRFLRRHEDAALYANFGDFSFYRLEIQTAHLVAGFGKIVTLAADDLISPHNLAHTLAKDLTAREEDIISHMNADHADALDNMARHFCLATEEGWQMTGLDAEGLDLRCGGKTGRIDFTTPLPNIDQARAYLVDLAKKSQKP